MADESNIMKCAECGSEKTVFELNPAVIDGKLKLICKNCWASAVETGRATIFTKEELTMFSELKDQTVDEGSASINAHKVAARLKDLIEYAAKQEYEDFEEANVEPMLSTVRSDDGILCLKIADGKFLITIERLESKITEDPPSRPKDILDSDVVG